MRRALFGLMAAMLTVSAVRQAWRLPRNPGGDYLCYRETAIDALAGRDFYARPYPMDMKGLRDFPQHVAPPGAAFMLGWLAWLPERIGRWVWLGINLIALLLAGKGAARIAGVKDRYGIAAALVWPFAVLNLEWGQVTPLMTAGVVWSAIWLDKRSGLSGVITGLAAGMKGWPLLLGMGMRDKKAALLGLVGGVGLTGALGLLGGLRLTLRYLRHPGGGGYATAEPANVSLSFRLRELWRNREQVTEPDWLLDEFLAGVDVEAMR